MTNPLVLAATYNKRSLKLTPDGAVDPDKLTRELGNIESALKFATSFTATVFNVRDYGADPTGARDSTNAIQRALSAAASASGVALFPFGTYRSNALSLPTAPWIIGYGATLRLNAGQDSGLLRLGPAVGATTQPAGGGIWGLTLDGNRTNQSNASTGTLSAVAGCLETYNLTGFRCVDVTIQDAKAVGWKMWGNNGTGSGQHANTFVEGLNIEGSGGTGWLLSNAKLGSFSNVRVWDGSHIGVEVVNDYTAVSTTQDLQFSNLHCHNTTGYGLAVYSGVVRCEWSNLLCTLTAGGGILWGADDPYTNLAPNEGVEGSEVTGFLGRKGGSAGSTFGILMEYGSKNCFSNISLADYNTGIYGENADNNRFSGVSVRSLGTVAINLASGCDRNSFADLKFFSPGATYNYINLNSGALNTVISGIDDYDATKISVNAGATGTRIEGAIRPTIATTTTTGTLTAVNGTLLCDATSGAITVNLMAASSVPGQQFTVKKIDASANAVTVDPNGGETIDGAANYPLTVQYQSVTCQSDGTTWWVL